MTPFIAHCPFCGRQPNGPHVGSYGEYDDHVWLECEPCDITMVQYNGKRLHTTEQITDAQEKLIAKWNLRVFT